MSLDHRTITGLFTARTPDSGDSDLHPDRVTLWGRATLTPQYSVPLVQGGEHIVVRPIDAVIEDGQLLAEVLDGDEVITQPLSLPVTVDDAANQAWSWQLEFQQMRVGQFGDSDITLPSRRLPVEPGEEPLDLADLSGTWSGGRLITRGERGLSVADVEEADGEVRFILEDGARTSAVRLPPGPANHLRIGTVTEGEAAATLEGDAPEQTLSLTLPRGAKGDKGDQGPEGPYGGTEVVDPQVAQIIVPGTATTAALDRPYRRGVSVAEFGAVGDGETDDSAAFTAALATGQAVYVPRGTWRVSGVVTDQPVDLTLARGAVISHRAAGACITVAGSESSTGVALTEDATEGSRTIVAPGHGVQADDWLRLASTRMYDPFATNIMFGELIRVDSVDGDTITCTTPIAGGPYSVGDDAVVRKLDLVDGVKISGPGEIRGARSTGLAQTGVVVRLAENVTISDVHFRSIDNRQLFLPDVSDVTVERCEFDWAVATSMGYAVSVCNAAQDVDIVNNRMRNVRHSLSTNNETVVPGVPRRIRFAHNVVRWSSTAVGGSQGGGDAIDTHAAAEEIWIEYNEVHGSSGQGINFEARTGRIVGNIVRSTSHNGIGYHNESALQGRVIVTDNVVEGAANTGISVVPGVRGTTTDLRGVVVSRNQVRRSGAYGIVVGSASTATGMVRGLTLTENRIEDNGHSTAIFVRGSAAVTQFGNVALGGGTTLSIQDAEPPTGQDDPGFLIVNSTASGTVVAGPTTRYLRVGVAAEGHTLRRIDGGSRGQIITVRQATASGTIAVDNLLSGGNIRIASAMTLTGPHDTLTLGFNGSQWVEVSRTKF